MNDEEKRFEADDMVRRGVRLAERGKLSEATAILERGIALAPEHALGRLHLGLTLAEEGRYEEADPHIRAALDLRPDSAAFHLFAGRVAFDAQRHEEARARLLRAEELSPQNDLVRAYLILNDWASGAPEVCEELDPDRLPENTGFLARLLALVELELRGALIEYVADDAREPFLDRIRIAYWLWRANAEQKRGAYDRALLRAHMAQELCPGHPGAVALQKSCREGILGVARRRVEEAPDSAEAHLELANALAEEEAWTEAEAELDAARSLDPAPSDSNEKRRLDQPEALRLRGRVAHGLGRIEEATELLSRGAEPGFDRAETHYYVGLCKLAAGDRRGALDEFEPLVAKVCWAVPLRYREFLAQRRRAMPSEAGT